MKILALISILFSSLAFGQTNNLWDLDKYNVYEGEGTWKINGQDAEGTWENATTVSVISEEGQPLILKWEEALVLLMDGREIDSEEAIFEWHFADASNTLFVIVEKGQKVGLGMCTPEGCGYLKSLEGETIAETIAYDKETRALTVKGQWQNAEGKGSWVGTLKRKDGVITLP